jgi:ribonuclease P protein component
MDREIQNSDNTIGVGFTASKKVGGAVARNRAKRRLRALAAEILPVEGRPGRDYVLIARPATVTRAFDDLRADLREALARTRRPRKPTQRRKAS